MGSSHVPGPITDLGIVLGVMVAGLTVIAMMWAGFGKKMWTEYRTQREFNRQFREDWTGTIDRPGVPGRPGVLEAIQEIRTDRVSMDQRLRRVETRSLHTSNMLHMLTKRMDALQGTSPTEIEEIEDDQV